MSLAELLRATLSPTVAPRSSLKPSSLSIISNNPARTRKKHTIEINARQAELPEKTYPPSTNEDATHMSFPYIHSGTAAALALLPLFSNQLTKVSSSLVDFCDWKTHFLILWGRGPFRKKQGLSSASNALVLLLALEAKQKLTLTGVVSFTRVPSSKNRHKY